MSQLSQVPPKASRCERTRSRHLSLLLLLAALGGAFLFLDAGSTYDMRKGWNTGKNLAIAENLSLDHRLKLFLRQFPDADGVVRYEMYSRFPIGSFALIKLAMMPFEGDLAAKTAAARMLMLALFAGAVLLGFLALRCLTADSWVALAATLFAFSSIDMLPIADTVSPEMTMGLFGVMLVFHGAVIHAHKQRFGQLVAKTCAALLIDWHVYALLMPLLAIGIARETKAAWPSAKTLPNAVRCGKFLWTLVRGHHVVLAFVALLFGGVVLGFNLATEYGAYDGEIDFLDLPSVRSAALRTGVDTVARVTSTDDYAGRFGFRDETVRDDLGTKAFSMLSRAGCAFIPAATPLAKRRCPYSPYREGKSWAEVLFAGLGALAVCAFLAWLVSARLVRFVRGRGWAALCALAVTDFVWATFVNASARTMFNVGLPLTLVAALLIWARRRSVLLAPIAAVLATGVFWISAWKVGQWVVQSDVEAETAIAGEFDAIREVTRGKTVFVPIEVLKTYRLNFYLAGSVLQYDLAGPVTHDWEKSFRGHANRARSYDFIVSDKRVEGPALLTPSHRFMFLYDGSAFASAHDFFRPVYRAKYATVVANEPIARSDFDIYRADGELVLLKAPCVEADTHGTFLVHIAPEEPHSLPDYAKAAGFENRDFVFVERGVTFDGKCMASISLPEYPIAAIATGRYMPGGPVAWRSDIEVGGG